MANQPRRVATQGNYRVMPEVHKNNIPVQPMAYNAPEAELKAPTPQRIQLVLDNSADSVNSKDYILFDALGFIEEIVGAKGDPTTQDMISYALLKKFMANAKIAVKSMRVKASSSSDQFANIMKMYVGGIDSNTSAKDIHLEDAVSANQYNPKIQVYNVPMTIGPRHGITCTVDAGEKVFVTLYIADVYSL